MRIRIAEKGENKICKNIRKLLKSNIVLALLMNIAFFGFFFFFLGIHFETNDDSGMASITAGATGISTSRIVFINVMIGKVLKHMTRVLPICNWYTVAQICCVYVALTSITYVLIKKEKKFGIISSILILSYFGFEGYVNLQFTKTAGFASVAGIILIAYSLEKRKSIIAYLLGGMILVVGSCYRFEACGLTLLILSYVGISYIFRRLKEHGEKKEIIQYIVAWLLVFIVVITAKKIDDYSYDSVQEYSEFRTYNSLRAELLDHGFPDFNENQELYQSLNISAEDLKLFQNWNFADPDVFNIDSMRLLVDAKKAKKIDLVTIKDFVYKILHGIVYEHSYIIYLAIAIVMILLNKKSWCIIMWSCAIYLMIEFWFYYTDRYLLHRVETVIWLAQSILILYYYEPENNNLKINAFQSVLLMLVAILINSNLYVDKYKMKREDWSYYRRIIEEIDRDDEHLYVLGTLDELVNKSYDALDEIPFGIRDNITLLGGWSTDFPTEEYVLEKYDINNIYKDSVNNPSIYFAGYGNVDNILGYIQRHYCSNAQLELVRNIEDMVVYRVITAE